MENATAESEHDTCICDLPNEILTEIFKFIPFMETEKLMHVCRRWRAVVDELVGVRAYVGKPSEFWSDSTNRWKQFEQIARVGTSTVSFSDVEDYEKVAKDPPPSFKHPHLVRRLSFDGFIRESTFFHLVESIRNLVYLELHLSTLEQIDFSGVKLNLPKLQELIISSNNYSVEHMAYGNMGKIMLNCTKLLEGPFFPRLVTLRLYIPIYVQTSTQLLRALFKFLVRHNSTMTMFLIRTEMRITEELADSESIEPSDISPEIVLLKSQELPFQVFRATFWAGDVEFVEFFRGILNQQRKLTWCGFVTHGDFQPFPLHIIKQNYLTLKKLHLSIQVVDRAGNGIALNCAQLQDCLLLEQLGFIGNRTPENTYGATASDLLNTALLPKKLKFIEIYNILIDNDNIQILTTQLPELHTLHLENIGDQGSLGMTMSTLVNMFKTKKIEKFGIVNGFNRKSLTCHEKDDEPGLTIAKLLLSKDVTPSLLATFESDGKIHWGYKEEDDKFS